MAYQIAPSCDACNSCKIICPIEGAIIAGNTYRIDETLCTDCGKCADDCPSASIYKPRIQLAA
jgi:MinD superfamily P-loop ATPase